MNSISELSAFLVSPVAQVALIIAIAELIKRMGFEKKYIPVIDVGLGLVSGIFVYGVGLGYEMITAVLIGLACGLSACGLFSGIKNLTETGKEIEEDDEGS